MTADKVLITNVSVLKKKYGRAGYRKIKSAIGALVIADRKTRHLETLFVDISDPKQMREFKTPPVVKPGSEVQNKKAIDGVYESARPHYVVLLDGPDVIPHIQLNNLIPHDTDTGVPSDLPYASDQPLAGKDVATYARVTRVVGRIPGLTGSNDPAFLISQLKHAATFKSRKRQDYLSYLAVSAFEFRKSTERSADTIFRSKLVKLSPPTASPATGGMLAPLSHFINCHGDRKLPMFFGQRGANIVPAMSSADIKGQIRRGTIVSAECCFGAELFAPASKADLPIANAYLTAGAAAFFGSTNIAFGSLDGNGCADLLAQYFLIEVLEGASIGRACLQARQRFVRSQKMEDLVNLKTLAQFTLLGDPSLQPVLDERTEKAFFEYLDHRAVRKTRRVALAAAGMSAVDCSGFPGRRIRDSQTRLHKQVRGIASDRGFEVSRISVEGFEIVGRNHYGNQMRSQSVKQTVFVAVHKQTSGRGIGADPTRILIAHAQNDKLIGLTEYVRR